MPALPPPDAATALRQTQAWVERAVIGLNLCPFAKAVQAKGLMRWVCSDARDPTALRDALRHELRHLAGTPIDDVETTLLVHPWVLRDFIDYNDFLAEADALLRELDLEGTLQIASFHPRYRFAGTRAGDIENATNRSPFPTLHLLREASIERAVAAFPEAEAIYRNNQRTLRALGAAGWAALQARCRRDAAKPGREGCPLPAARVSPRRDARVTPSQNEAQGARVSGRGTKAGGR